MGKHEVEQYTAGLKQFVCDLVLAKALSVLEQQSDKAISGQVSCVEMMDEGEKAVAWSEQVKNGSSEPL